ncbi:MAG: PSD1 domain-containing protein [Planctomycetaceae bacterium]|nr:PSD1 domain-containing protein [Planctomycetaceae bacterium]
MRIPIVPILTIVLSAILAYPDSAAAQAPDFNRDIRPLLADRCLACHGPDAKHREADLRLDDFRSLTQDRDGHPVVVPGRTDIGELIHRITATDPDLVMPPPHIGKPLSAAEAELLKRWIAAGADVEAHWAYVPPQPHPQPEVHNAGWIRNSIDRFILHRLEQEKLSPSPDADPVTLLRRMHFDLTGLPPKPEETEPFITAVSTGNSDSAVADLVDRLLTTDEHAERMAMYWLDLVRYADTVGYHGDQDHSISPYRDWVIDAFAANMPFDQFTREQLAGDLLPRSDIDQKIASGYNRLLQTSHEGGVQPKEYLAIYAADRVRNLSAVWMGATVGCAQCHDHKYDPYTMKDFYSLAAFFADLDEDQHFRLGSNALPTKRPPEIKVHTRREREQLEQLRRELAAVETQSAAAPQNQQLAEQRRQLTFAVEDLENSARLTMISAAKEPRMMRVLPRGNWLDDSGEVVTPAVPEFLGTVRPASDDRATRLDLANWLCDADDGAGLLTARVFVNRLWYLMFGNGLVTSLEDFGGQGASPEHPELLDHLALEFTGSGWDVRHVLRMIVNSRTYRQSSAWTPELRHRDPTNALFARQSAFRLPAEMIRDTALEVSGLLVHQVGGPSVRPYQPAGYYRHLNFPTRTYQEDSDDRQWRRGLYIHWQRQFLHPMLRAFDAPSREECTAQRPRSNTPLAALTLLNDPTFVEAARAFAVRLLQDVTCPTDEERLRRAFQMAVSRPSDPTELEVLKTLLQNARRDHQADRAAAEHSLAVGLKEFAADIDVTDVAAWSQVARAILNLDETMTRN